MTLAGIVAQIVVAILLVGAFLVLWLDRYRFQPVPWLLAAWLWGFAVPIAAKAVWAFAGWPPPDPLLGRIGAAPAAAAVVIAILAVLTPTALIGATHFVEGPADAALVGLVAGLGLAASSTPPFLGPGEAPTIAGGILAVLLGGAVAATAGAGIGLTKLAAAPQLRLAWVAAALLAAAVEFAALVWAAAACRSAWPADEALCEAGLAVVAAAALAAVVAASLAIERRVLLGQLGEEVELGVVPAWVVEIVPSYRRRIRSDWWQRRDERQEIVRLLVALAFRKHQLRNLSAERLRLYGLEVGRLRQRARILLALAPAPTVDPAALE